MTQPNSNPSTANLTFVGHVSIDKVENMNGTRTQPGGGALYAAIAAKALNVKTAIITTVGKDFSFTNCFGFCPNV